MWLLYLQRMLLLENIFLAWKDLTFNKPLELMEDNSIIAIQDMGAAGLTSSSIEMASKGNLGIELDLSKVPCREENMTPYEIMLSESQERMLIILENGKEDYAKKIFDK